MRKAYPAKKSTPPPQPNPLAETGRTNLVHVEEWFHLYGTRMDLFGTNPKGKHGYPGYRAVGGSLGGGGGGDRYAC